MTTLRQLTDEVLQILHGFGLEQPRTAFLNASITDTALSFTVADASSVQAGIAQIEDELIYIQSVNRATNTVTVAADGRGYYGTTPAAHGNNVRLTVNPAWPRNRVKSAINDTIVSTYPNLFGVAQAQFDYSPAVTTYSLPAEADGVLRVTADVNGPSKEQQEIRRYGFNSVAPTDDWATTNTITILEAVSPGRTVTVTYTKKPSALASDAAELTTSGLAESAKLAIVYGACSQLTATLDIARLTVDTASADEYAETNQISSASRISGQLFTRAQVELEAERKRLRATTPVPIRVRKR